jgi:hypothetical protein
MLKREPLSKAYSNPYCVITVHLKFPAVDIRFGLVVYTLNQSILFPNLFISHSFLSSSVDSLAAFLMGQSATNHPNINDPNAFVLCRFGDI